jgi:hypothetical protein
MAANIWIKILEWNDREITVQRTAPTENVVKHVALRLPYHTEHVHANTTGYQHVLGIRAF